MKNKLTSILVTVLLCGAWGVFSYVADSAIMSMFPLAASIFYPILFGGITVIIAGTSESAVPLTRALVVGLISGFIYQILSPVLPFISSVLAGASMGGGLVTGGENIKDIFNRVFAIIKGILIFPIIIYTGELLTSFIGAVTPSNMVLWFSWGGCIGLGICLISMPIFHLCEPKVTVETISELDEFKSETREIKRALEEIESKYK